MTLLALVTGAPRSSLGLLRFLGEHKDDEQFDLLEQHMREHSEPAERQYVDAALAGYRIAAGPGPLALGPLRNWASQVARFSFRSGRT